MVKITADTNTAIRLTSSKVMTALLKGMDNTNIENEYFKVTGVKTGNELTVIVNIFKSMPEKE